MTNLDPEKLNAYVFDIDRTLAYHVDRGPFDYKKIPTDEPILGIANIAKNLYGKFTIIMLTGRPERVRNLTEQWLKDKGIPFNCLILKEGNEYQKSAKTKKESIESIMEDYNVLAVFEDSPACVDMYRELGLVTCQIHTDSK